LTARQASLKAIHNAFSSLYQALASCPDPDISLTGQELARRDALAQELEVFKASNEHSYKNSARSSIVGIGNRDKARLEKAVSDSLHEKAKAGIFVRYHIDKCTEIGTQSEVSKKRMDAVNKAKGKLTIPKLKEKLFVCPLGALSKWSYVTEIPEEWGQGGTNPDSLGEDKKCDRCGNNFIIKVPDANEEEGSEPICSFHFGRKRPTDTKDPLTRRKMLAWTCCGRFANDSSEVEDKKCCTAPSHVFKEEEGAKLHSRQAFIRSADHLVDKGKRPAAHDVLALDCELCYTAAGMSLTELCVVDSDGRVLLDLMVLPPASILDYNTRSVASSSIV
jgi:RNA exonuclease 1